MYIASTRPASGSCDITPIPIWAWTETAAFLPWTLILSLYSHFRVLLTISHISRGFLTRFSIPLSKCIHGLPLLLQSETVLAGLGKKIHFQLTFAPPCGIFISLFFMGDSLLKYDEWPVTDKVLSILSNWTTKALPESRFHVPDYFFPPAQSQPIWHPLQGFTTKVKNRYVTA